ncbi:MTH1187 family thiamine-binding protein [uncultured Thiodictyon sp.]|uniref:MTH1187 family thiamine-binding protein n=1 Tax=uncultured Thiodictyon sp. TaxID=1846217 RepID=UPI0025D9529B|nr:MTH1187 family thiamine-binding protein [uncultured Thiodictyon sp.]
MYVIAQFTVIPIGTSTSLSGYVAACERVLAATTGINYEMHANGTNLEGEWEAVMDAIKRCHDTLHGMGVPRLSTNVTLGTRTDRPQRMVEKLSSVRAKLADQS